MIDKTKIFTSNQYELDYRDNETVELLVDDTILVLTRYDVDQLFDDTQDKDVELIVDDKILILTHDDTVELIQGFEDNSIYYK